MGLAAVRVKEWISGEMVAEMAEVTVAVAVKKV